MDKVEDAQLPRTVDVFFVAAGADYRAYENLRRLNSSGCKLKHLVVYDFRQRRQLGDHDYMEKYEAFKEISSENLTIVDVDISDPSTCITSLRAKGVESTNYDTIGLDISCFTKPFFYVLLRFLATQGLARVLTFYTQPRAYRFAEEHYRSFRSSSGPISVREVPSYPGEDAREGQRMLVLLLGFDGDLAAEISETVAPTKIVVVNGFPGYEPKFKDISIIANERMVTSNTLLYSRSSNPFEVYNLLKALYGEGDNTAINIAPLGNKPMALGACLFAIHHPRVRVVYPFPQDYENVTTDNCSLSWLYEIPFSLWN